MTALPRSVLIGGETLLIEAANMLRERGHAVPAVVTRNPAIAAWAAGQDIAVLERAGALHDVAPFDFLFSVANLSIVPADVLALPRRAAINFHDGPLPEYAGVNTPVWALLNGEAAHGITWHVMTAAVDEGDVLVTRRFEIAADETAVSINTRCFAAAIDSFAELVDGLDAGTLSPRPQGCRPHRYFSPRNRPPAAAVLRFDAPAAEIGRLVRALDHGAHRNPLGSPKALVGGQPLLVQGAAMLSTVSGAAPGTILQVEDGSVTVATADADVLLSRLSTPDGAALAGDALAARGIVAGARFDILSPERAAELGRMDEAVAASEGWWARRLAAMQPLRLPQVDAAGSAVGAPTSSDAPIETAGDARDVLAALLAYCARIADKAAFTVAFADPIYRARFDGHAALFAASLPFEAKADMAQGFAAFREAVDGEVRQLHRHAGYAADLAARVPELRSDAPPLPLAIELVDRLDDAAPAPGADLTVTIAADGRSWRWLRHPRRLDDAAVSAMQRGVAVLLAAGLREPARPLAELDLLSEDEQAAITGAWNATAAPWRDDACIHHLFAEQAARTPDRPAVTSRGITLSYAELDRRSNRLARHLQGKGVRPGVLVGLHLERGVEMMVALLAVHKAGGAYVPLDPAYPADRIAYMIVDAAAAVIVTEDRLAKRLTAGGSTLVCVDVDGDAIRGLSCEAVDGGATPRHLAYVIYTSGSTGRPKGVMVEHRNVSNFFTGMDAHLEPDGTWLAVTSLSFDISVLELCWTVARGLHVVIASGDELKGGAAAGPASAVAFSLFYFASTEGESASEQYRLLLEGARFADTHDFAAVWTPERHFHAFGGLYPNPSVAGAAIAAITSRVQIRGGSVVAPLHHPARIAEEWALVDNLSNGRVGIAFASGWQPNDFLLQPANYADRKGALDRSIETVRALWRGEPRRFAGPLGEVEVVTYPRPVQRDLPVWITSAGNADTFAAAGRAGANLLTHLLGQTVDELAQKIAAYRRAWADAGHAGEGQVTLMLHSFVGDDPAAIRAAVREPLKNYLRSSTDLVKQYAWSFPAFKRRPGMADGAAPDLQGLDPAEMDALLDHAFERYYETGGLFGTPESCLPLIGKVRAAGVDEIACLIDFGVPVQTVLDHLPALDSLRRLAQPATESERPADGFGELMARHEVTHLQCTPSMAQMLVGDADARAGLAQLRQMMVGGEAFPPALAQELQALVGGDVFNMYGPTETTIWSAIHRLDGAGGSVPLGRPLANQQIYILDRAGRALPPGIPGELVIGGAGVVRGYLNRPELTAERFVAHPFDRGARAYRTGDLARQRPDGTLEFRGRLDHQVKIRGYRIELGEIEAVLASHPSVEHAIVSAREDSPGDVRLVAYFVATAPPSPAREDLLRHMGAHLPDFMLPSHFVALPALPRTPNGKVDRAALPPPEQAPAAAAPAEAFVPPANDLQQTIASVWQKVLKLPRIGTRDNFFDLGGHSLLAVQVHRELRATLPMPLAITDVFRFPTVDALSRHLAGDGGGQGAAAAQGAARAAGRRAALQRRAGPRVPVEA